jgi:fermentation-respiration switch protein FrsA (DUF1100 family)
MFRWFERAQVYHPGRELKATGAELRRPFEDVRLRTEDGVELHAWFFPADDAAGGEPRVFLVCHGNAGNISHRLGLCAALLRTGAAVLLFDYRGYGLSSGRPSEEGTYRDAQAAFGWLRARGFTAEQIVAFGESLGGAVATELAVREPLGGLVLQSTFTSIPDMGAELFPWLPVRWLGTIRYDTLSKLSRLHMPLLILHSREDDLVAFRHAERNLAAANEPKRLAELSGGHNDPVFEQPAFQEVLKGWLRSLPPSAGR